MSFVREPAVAGYFYPRDPVSLRTQVETYLKEESVPQREKAAAIVSPHAGYQYSGKVAAAVFSKVAIPKKIFVLSPNHHGVGAVVAINLSGSWRTPLGEARIDEELARAFQERCDWAEEDHVAHRSEHSLEVQIPFLQCLNPDFRFVPLTIQHVSFEMCEKIGEDLAACITNSKEPILIVASSDMNHYESQEITMKKDQIAIDPILNLDPEGLYREVHRHRVSMCGIIPTTIALVAAKKLGASRASLVRHATSGDVTGDYDGVVGYAGFVIN